MVSTRTIVTVGLTALFVCFVVGCFGSDDRAFVKSHDAIVVGMTLGEAFDAGLADYLAGMGVKNVPGATLPEHRSVSSGCARHILDISFTGVFSVHVYCNMNSPASPQLVPAKQFADKRAFVRALDEDYAFWSKNMEFRVESPPQAAWGIYRHYLFTTDRDGRINTMTAIVSPIEILQGRKGEK